MPLYEYRCPSCAKRFEALARSFRDTAACPSCGSADVERLLSTFAMAGFGKPASMPMASGGGCCGGGCGCAH